MTPPRLALLRPRDPAPADLALIKLAGMMGVPVTTFEIPGAGFSEELLDAVRTGRHRAFAAGGEAISIIRRTARLGPPSLNTLFEGFDYAFVYGLSQAGDAGDDLTAWLSAGSLGRPRLLQPAQTEYSFARHPMCRQLSGLAFVDDGADPCTVFSDGAGSTDAAAIISAERSPFLALARVAGCEVFLLAGDRIAQVDAPARAGDPGPRLYPAVLPALLFLRRAFGEYCWDNPAPRAVLTIDDPPLRPRYGFFCYDGLISEANRRSFASTIAFIPWNYRRSAPQTVELLKRHADKVSICIHGCDHTAGEFKSGDEALLRAKARLALERVGRLEDAVGLGCEPIMIFPQGGFSKAALKALRAERYVAAVNTTVFASDGAPGELSIADVLDAAVTRYEGCPIFGRRYPRAVTDFAFDLILGRPAVVVEHHGFFRNGYRAMADFVDRINALEPRVSWQPLARAICASALYRRTGERTAAVKCYTDQAIVSNPYGRRMAFRLSRKAGAAVSAASVSQDGSPVEWRLNGERLEAAIELEAEAESVITFAYSSPCAEPVRRLGFAYGARAALRRYLCDFRDNYLARNAALLGASEKLARRFLGQH